MKRAVKNEGYLSLWKGNWPAILLNTGFSGISFYCHDKFLEIWKQTYGPSMFDEFCCGAGAAAVATVGTYPLDLIRTRLATQTVRIDHGLRNSFKHIIARDGFVGFYAGVPITLVGVVPAMAMQFALFGTLVDRTDRSTVAIVACGGVSGIVAKVITMPIDVLKRRQQVHPLLREQKWLEKWEGEAILVNRREYNITVEQTSKRNILEVARWMLVHEGPASFFKGTSAAVVKSGLTSAICFVLKEMCTNYHSK
eukprot:c8672_g1_i2.p1 GENE.c8672_g1_i2~~c8672_g1_i2.p1  ORF type:complete len:253 (-),score=64.19 c8672_g1_i2:75-833(-)